MKILVVGGGGREHALVHVLGAEPGVDVVCAPGNPGIARGARCIPVNVSQPAALLAIAEHEAVDLTVVGPELPLSHGVSDLFASAGRPIVGPTQAAAALESSKAFAKDFMARHRVPTARYRVCATAEEARDVIMRAELGFPVVVKADGLAAGKGVVIADDRRSALATIDEAMVARRFGAAGDRVVLEECLTGPEVSYFVLSDGRSFVPMSSAQDHKRIFDGDKGPNTGGMGAFGPSPLLTPALERQVIDQVVSPVIAGMAAEGTPFAGFLYVGLMLTPQGPKVIEFNVRFGDPEAQVVLPMLDGGLADLLMAAATRRLDGVRARFRDEPHVGVVVAARGYPDTPESGKAVLGLDAAGSVLGALVFHAGTADHHGGVVTAGGRVLTVVGRGPSFPDAIATAYKAVSHVRFDGMQYRTDIGRKAIPVKYAVVTFGCRVNQADSLEIEGALLSRGGTCVPAAEAELVVVNTCSVTASADQGARQTVRKVARENPGARIVVTGCYATRRPDELWAQPGVVRVVPNSDKDRIAQLLVSLEPGAWSPGPESTTSDRYAGLDDGPCGARLTPGVAGRTAFTLRVQTGCDQRCSYCIIPGTRGTGRSKPVAWVREAVGAAIGAGYREIAVCGVHLGSYGRDLADGSSLTGLVRMLGDWPADVLFRISSLEPMDCTPELVAAIAASGRIAPHLHLPLQHGDDAMLRAMRRPYTAAYYEDLVAGIADAMPDASIGTDLIAGFPGETSAQADALAMLLERLPLSHLHVFPYSDRPGTEASRIKDKIDGPVIRARASRLRAIGERLSARFRSSQIGKVRRALVVDDGSSAVTDNYLKLELDRPRARNEWVSVLVETPHSGRVLDKAEGRRQKAETAEPPTSIP